MAHEEVCAVRSHCDVERVRAELVDGGDPNDEERTGNSPVSVAARGSGASRDGAGCLETLKLLVDAGGELRPNSGGMSVLVLVALGQGDPEIVDWPIAQGEDPCEPLHPDVQARYDVRTLRDIADLEGQPPVVDAIALAVAGCG